MGAFFLIRRASGADADARLGTIDTAFRNREWGDPVALSAGGCDIRLYPKKSGAPVSAHIVDPSNFCAATGTLLYRQKMATEALSLLHEDLTGNSVAWHAQRREVKQ